MSRLFRATGNPRIATIPHRFPRCDPLIAPIELGLIASYPSTIFWCVVAVIVGTINYITGWSRSHISVEILERGEPALTYFYAATTVVFPTRVFWIITTLFHCIPCFEFRSLCHSMLYNFDAAFKDLLHPEAPARYDAASSYMI